MIAMACDQAKSNTQSNPWQPPELEDQEKQPRGIKRKQSLRKSLRLQAIQQSNKRSLSGISRSQGVIAPLSPPASDTLDSNEARQPQQIVYKRSTSSRKRKRGREGQDTGHSSCSSQEQQLSEHLQTSPSSRVDEENSHQTPASDISDSSTDPLEHWIKTGWWGKEYSKQDSQVREDYERGKWSPEEQRRMAALQEYFQKHPAFAHMQPYLATVRSSPSVRRKHTNSTLQTPSDQVSQKSKGSQYYTPEYDLRLERKGSYMDEYHDLNGDDDKVKKMKTLCRTFLEREQTIPQDTFFRDDLFVKICQKIRNCNEPVVVQDITRLIVPSAVHLAIYGATHLNHLYETVSESWTSMAEFEGSLPQPDYSVGFRQSAFTSEQLDKLKPFVGELGSKLTTYFMATMRMCFPFLTCEVKCGAAALDIADRQNAQSMCMALRALVTLFKLLKREKELDRKLLTFSISHDDRSVRIYGHYPMIKDDKTTFRRHLIHAFDFTALDGKERWTAYKFTKNVYDLHALKLHKLICSGIDELPADLSVDLSRSAFLPASEPQSAAQSNIQSISVEDKMQSSSLASEEVTPSTSYTEIAERPAKKPRNQ